MDLLAALLDQEGDSARVELRALIASEGPEVRERSYNCFDVAADLETSTVRVWDVLDGQRPPDVFTVEEFAERLA